MIEILFGLGMCVCFLLMSISSGIKSVSCGNSDHISTGSLVFWTIGCFCGFVMFMVPFFNPYGFAEDADRIFATIPLATFGLQLVSLIPVWLYKLKNIEEPDRSLLISERG